jgi:DNA-binding XRE family transcriptional regulator
MQRLSDELPKLRRMLKLTQSELGDMCGMSRITISKMEKGAANMSWLQFMALCQLFTMNRETREHLCEAGVMEAKLLQYLQVKDENIPPDINVTVGEELTAAYKRYLETNDGRPL